MNIEKTVGWKALIFKDQGFFCVEAKYSQYLFFLL